MKKWDKELSGEWLWKEREQQAKALRGGCTFGIYEDH